LILVQHQYNNCTTTIHMRVGPSMWDPPSCEGLLYSCCIDVVNLTFSIVIYTFYTLTLGVGPCMWYPTKNDICTIVHTYLVPNAYGVQEPINVCYMPLTRHLSYRVLKRSSSLVAPVQLIPMWSSPLWQPSSFVTALGVLPSRPMFKLLQKLPLPTTFFLACGPWNY
jgi:hypothetical protein